MVERAAATTDIAGSGQLWVNSADSHLYFTDDSSTDYQISGAAGATTLSGLTDTNITTPAEGGLLMWDSTPGEWVDATTLTGAYTLSGFCIFSGNGAGGNALRADNDIQVSDNTALKFGTGSGGNGDIIIQWDGLDLEVTSIIANQTINFRDGMHMRFWDQTDTDWFDFYVSVTDLVLTESGLTSVQWPSAGTLDLDMNDNEIQAPILRDYAIAQADYTPTGTSQALVYTDGPAFTVDLESASGNMTLSITGGPPSGNYGQVTVRVQQDGATARTVTWGGGDTYRHAGGTAHPMNTTLDGFTIYTLETFDAGTSWEVSGADYS
jgi:hypothetical protein